METIGLDTLKKNKAQILVPNHVNAFVDPTIIAMQTNPKLRFFARSDVFKSNKLARWALESMNISPIYRIQEGFSEIKNNNKTFIECTRRLKNNEALLIFAEGICVQEKRVKKFKKGLAKIYFQALEDLNFEKEIEIIPIGLNYSYPLKMQSKFVLNVGPPVNTKKYNELYKTDKIKAIIGLTTAVENALKDTIVHIDKNEYDELYHALEQILVPQVLSEKNIKPGNLSAYHQYCKKTADFINEVSIAEEDNFNEFASTTINYNRKLFSMKLRDHLLRNDTIEKMNFSGFVSDFFLLWVGFPIYILGMLLNYLPYFLAQRFVQKKIKLNEFKPSVHSNLGMVLWILNYCLVLLILNFLFRDAILVAALALIIPVAFIFALRYHLFALKIFGKWRLLRYVRKDKSTVEHLMAERNKITEYLSRFSRYFN